MHGAHTSAVSYIQEGGKCFQTPLATGTASQAHEHFTVIAILIRSVDIYCSLTELTVLEARENLIKYLPV